MKKEINVKIEGKEWTEALDKAFKKANAKAKIDGFRPGHAPKEVFLKNMVKNLFIWMQQRCVYKMLMLKF